MLSYTNYKGGEPMKEHIPVYLITDNVLSVRRIFNLPILNLVEGGILSIGIWKLINIIPFVPKVKIIVTICVCIAVLVACIVGYHGQSITEFIVNFIKEQAYSKNYHMRSINDEYGKDIIHKGTSVNESYADRIIKKIKECIVSRQ